LNYKLAITIRKEVEKKEKKGKKIKISHKNFPQKV